MNDPSFDVIVIGAGVAGLTAATQLRSAGLQVVILEGRDRAGGRVWTDDRLGVPVDLGAAWLHGVADNPLVPIALSLELKLVETTWTSTQIHDHDGSWIPTEEVESSHASFGKVIDEVFSGKLLVRRQTSLQDAVRVAMKKHFVAGRPALTQWQIEYMANDYAENLHRVSHRAAQSDARFQGGDFAPARGFAPVVHRLAEGLDIRFEHRVRIVDYSSTPLQVHTDRGLFTGRSALITLPIGVLRTSVGVDNAGQGVEFHPRLPAKKVKAISRLGVGLMNKVILRFPRSFWHNRNHVFGWVGDGPGQYLVFVNSYPLRQLPILEAQIVGDDAREIQELDDEQTVGRAMRALRTMFGAGVPAPDAAIVTRWGQDPFALGSYSYATVGASPRDRQILGEPIRKRLYFAGEATHLKVSATVHGAYLTGLREAERIAHDLNNRPSPHRDQRVS